MSIDLTEPIIIETLEDLVNELEINDDSIVDNEQLYLDLQNDEMYCRFIYRPQELNAITLLNRLKIRLDPVMVNMAAEFLRVSSLYEELPDDNSGTETDDSVNSDIDSDSE